MGRWKVVVTDWEYADLRYEEKVLGGGPFELIPAQCRTEEEVIAACRDADAILNQYAPLGRRVVEALDRCRVIVRYGVGVNTIDVAAATEKGICVANVPDYCFDEVSDHALALLLNLARRITAAGDARHLDQVVTLAHPDVGAIAPVDRQRAVVDPLPSLQSRGRA